MDLFCSFAIYYSLVAQTSCFYKFQAGVIECGLNNIEANQIFTRYHNLSRLLTRKGGKIGSVYSCCHGN